MHSLISILPNTYIYSNITCYLTNIYSLTFQFIGQIEFNLKKYKTLFKLYSSG